MCVCMCVWRVIVERRIRAGGAKSERSAGSQTEGADGPGHTTQRQTTVRSGSTGIYVGSSPFQR